MQQLAARRQMKMLIEKVREQLGIETVFDKKTVTDSVGGKVGDGAGGSSFRRQRGVRAKRGESIKKERPNLSYKSRKES